MAPYAALGSGSMSIDKDWRPNKGMTETGVSVRKVVGLSHAQCDALSELAAPLLEHHRLFIQQTVSESGGTHLYVRIDEDEYHVAVNGNISKMGVVSGPTRK